MGDVKKVGILLRVSTEMQASRNNTDNQDKDDFDLPMQRAECKRFIEARPDWEFGEEYLEVGSGFKNSIADRPKIQEIISDIKNKNIDILLVFMYDRIARKTEVLPIMHELIKAGAEVWSVREGQMSFEKHVDDLLNFISFWQAEGESKKTSERVLAAMTQMAREGKYTGGKPPYGYMAVETGNITKKRIPERTLAINEDEARIVRMIFELAVTHGYGCHRIAKHINEKGIRNRSGKQWRSSSVSNVLNNPIYKGFKAYNRTTTKGNSCKNGQWRTSPDDWILPDEPNPDWVIVSEDVWNSVQSFKAEKLAVQAEQYENNLQFRPKGGWSQLLFIGYIYCGCCGSAIITGYSPYNWYTADGEKKRGNKPLYRCCDKTSGMIGCDAMSGYTQEVVEGVVIDEVNSYLDTLKNIELADEIKKLQKENIAVDESSVRALRKELANTEKKIATFEDEIYKSLNGDSHYTPERLNGLLDKEISVQKDITARLEKASTTLEQKRLEYADMLQLQQLIPIWSEEFANANHDQKKVLLSRIIEKVIVYPERIEIKLRVLIEDFLKGFGDSAVSGGNGGNGERVESNYFCSNRGPHRYR